MLRTRFTCWKQAILHGLVTAPLLAAPPVAVSPAGTVATTTPTLSWSLVEDATGYELAVYEVGPEGETGSEPALRVTLPAGVSSWTAAAARGLRAGGRYVWSVRTLDAEAGSSWSEPVFFEVARGPSVEDVEAALETLRRFREERLTEPNGSGEAGRNDARAQRAEALSAAAAPAVLVPLPGAAAGDGSAVRAPELVAKGAPVLGSPSLTLSDDLSLGPESDVFKDGEVFLWNDVTVGNLALGHRALASAADDATQNTAVGRLALEETRAGEHFNDGSLNTAVGDRALQFNTIGKQNTGLGSNALFRNTLGSGNTASGASALHSNTEGTDNTAHGHNALFNLETGVRNVAIGVDAGVLLGIPLAPPATHATSLSDNIYIGSWGEIDEANTLRVGRGTGTGESQQTRAFVSGIRGTTTDLNDAVTVVIDSEGQLGTLSSSQRVKQDIRDLGALSERLLALRPVAFRYRHHAEADPETPLQFGLLAEEVAEVFPELVVHDTDGRPETVKYHLLTTLLLNELQRQAHLNEARARELTVLRERVAAIDGQSEARGPE